MLGKICGAREFELPDRENVFVIAAISGNDVVVFRLWVEVPIVLIAFIDTLREMRPSAQHLSILTQTLQPVSNPSAE